MRWRDERLLHILGIDLPIIQAPMAGSDSPELAIAVANAGGLGSLACAMLTVEKILEAYAIIRHQTSKPINLNFFCHPLPDDDPTIEQRWQTRLQPYYTELDITPGSSANFTMRMPFDETLCSVVETIKPAVVSFHFGLPEHTLLTRVKATGALIMSTATTVAEAIWLEIHGCDIIIAQGAEAGGHRGMFLTPDIYTQVGTIALVPQIVDAVSLPVIAAGGIADARGIAAALMLGASAVQLGTAYLFCPEAKLSPFHQQALPSAKDDNTALTNVFSGRPARGIINRLVAEVGPMSSEVPAFPLAGRALAPLRAKAEALGKHDFTNLWAGQAASLCCAMPAAELTKKLAQETLELFN